MNCEPIYSSMEIHRILLVQPDVCVRASALSRTLTTPSGFARDDNASTSTSAAMMAATASSPPPPGTNNKRHGVGVKTQVIDLGRSTNENATFRVGARMHYSQILVGARMKTPHFGSMYELLPPFF